MASPLSTRSPHTVAPTPSSSGSAPSPYPATWTPPALSHPQRRPPFLRTSPRQSKQPLSSILDGSNIMAHPHNCHSAMSSLQSPAKIGSSPARGRGISSLFPPSPDNPLSVSEASTAGTSSAASQPKSKIILTPLDLGRRSASVAAATSSWDNNKAVLPSTSLKGKQRDFQFPPRHADNNDAVSPLSPVPNKAANITQRKRFDMSDWQFDLAAIASDGIAETPTASNFPNGPAYSPPCLGEKRYTPPLSYIPKTVLKPRKSTPALLSAALSHSAHAKTAPQLPRHRVHLPQHPPPSRLPVPKVPLQSLTGAAAATANETCSVEDGTLASKRSLRPLAIRTNSNSSTRTLQMSDSKSLTKRSSTPLFVNAQYQDAVSPSARISDNPVSSFDQSTSVLRHRHRTLSISESEGHSSEDELDEGLPDSPDLLQAMKQSYVEDEDSMQHDGRSSRSHPDLPELQLGRTTGLADRPDNSSPEENEISPFLDTPGRKRGASLPFSKQPLGLLSPLPPHPQQSSLKSSRISYPPKMLNFDKKGRDPLYASTPASSSTSKPLDQLFLASILNGTASANLTANTPAASSPQASPARPRALSRSSSGALNTGNILHSGAQTSRKRNANGAMIVGAGGSRIGGTSKLAANSPINATFPLSRTGSASSRLSSVLSESGSQTRRSSLEGGIGGNEEDEGAASSSTCASIPHLTDSSSTTSSLASSQRSSRNQAQCSAPSACKNEGDDSSFMDLEDVSITTIDSGDATRDDISSSKSPRKPLRHMRRTSSTNASLHLASDASFKSLSDQPVKAKQRSPHFKNVRPLQAAFMNSGLLSKKTRARVERDSGVGLGATPSPTAWSRLLDSRDTSFCSTPGSSFGSPAKLAFGSPHTIPDAALQCLPHLAEQPHMPDTPCKRPFLTHPRVASGAVSQQLHPLAQSSRPLQTRSSSSCSSTSDSSSVVNSIPGSAVKHRSPHAMRPSTGTSASPSSTGSPCGSNVKIGLMVPEGSCANSGGISNAHALRKTRPTLFRRRSSGQLSTGPDGSFLPVTERSGGAIRSGIIDWEPMTPTRAASGTSWLQVPQLAVSPQPGNEGQLRSGSPNSAEPPLVSPTSPLCAVPPHLMMRTGFDRQQSASLPRPALPHIKGLKRPAFRLRHSSSHVHTLRQTELMSPDRFATMYSINRTLGQGEFSEAYEVQDRVSGQVSAVKKTKVPFSGPKDRVRRLEEVDALRLLSTTTPISPYIVQLYDAWEQSGNLYIQTELCAFGNLSTFLEEYGRLHEVLDEARVWKVLGETSAGVAHMHQQGLLHLDLKPANVFITSQGGLKIGDFGLATRWPRVGPVAILQSAAVQSPGWDSSGSIWSSERIRTKSSSEVAVPPSDLEREGDREYIAPEILRGQYGPAADMFSLGLVILETAANVVLPDNGSPWRKLRENDFSDVELGHLSDELVNVIAQLLMCEPDRRLTIEELVKHPVVSKIQDMRQHGIMREAMLENYMDDDRPFARGAVIEEDATFLPNIFSEVRLAWHSSNRGGPVESLETSTCHDMDMDDD